MSDLPNYHILAYIISVLGQLIVLIACIALIIKQRTLATALMLTGMLLTVIFGLVGFLTQIFTADQNPETLIRNQGIFSTLNTLSYLIFGIGLLLFALKWSRTKIQGG